MLRNEIEIPKTMASVICHGPEDYRLEELPVPEVGPVADHRCHRLRDLDFVAKHRRPPPCFGKE